MIGVPRVTDTWHPKVVESSMTRATWSSFVASHLFYLSHYNNIAPGLGEYSSKAIYTHPAINQIAQEPMSKEWSSMNSVVTALMVESLSKRAQQL